MPMFAELLKRQHNSKQAQCKPLCTPRVHADSNDVKVDAYYMLCRMHVALISISCVCDIA